MAQVTTQKTKKPVAASTESGGEVRSQLLHPTKVPNGLKEIFSSTESEDRVNKSLAVLRENGGISGDELLDNI